MENEKKRRDAGLFFRENIKEGIAGGLSRRRAILRARDIVEEFTGIDLSDAIHEKFLVTDIKENVKTMQVYSDFFIEGIKSAIKLKRRPTKKIIRDRKVRLREIDDEQMQAVIDNLLDLGLIREDKHKKNPAYYPVEKDSAND